MTTVWITRIAYTPQGVFGILEANNFRCYTLERPYKDNLTFVSCIPCGEYKLKKGTFYAGGGYENYEIVYVEGRTNIEIHAGNVMTDSKGCILLGLKLGHDGLILKIEDGYSRQAIDGFVHSMGGHEEAELVIQNAVDTLIWGLRG